MSTSRVVVTGVCFCAFATASAQPSTANVADQRPIAFELALGREFGRFSADDFDPAATAITASVTSALQRTGGLRASAWYIRRPSGGYSGEVRLLVIGAVAEVRIHVLPNRLVLSPMVGYGFTPYIASRQMTGVPPNTARGTVRATGKNWIGGVSLRTRHVFVEWMGIGLLGAEAAVYSSREYFPLSIGLRY